VRRRTAWPERPIRAVAFVRGRIDWRSDAGFAAGGEAIPFGVLIFVIGTLMVTNLWAVIDVKMATNGAAREAARQVAESDGPGANVTQLGKDAAEASLQTHERDPGRMDYIVNIPDGWQPCARAEVAVTYPVPLINLPFLDVAFPDPIQVTSTHSEIIDPYRSRAAGTGEIDCG
jgi:hypothetical protein